MLTVHICADILKRPKHLMSERRLFESYSSLFKQPSVGKVHAELRLGKAILFILFVPETPWKNFACPGEHVTPAGSHTVLH